MSSVNAPRPVNLGSNFFVPPEFMTQGNRFFVRPGNGSDAHDGKTMESAFATLSQALSAATADQNDVIFLVAEDNAASGTTARVTTASAATLAWNKDLVHLVGINAGGMVGQRSRIAFESDFVTAADLFTLSANGCLIKNVHFFAGVASANPLGAMLVSGERNHIVNCHIAGIGANEMDSAGNYSLKLTGSENFFEKCTIGLDTIARGTAANSGLLVDTAATRNAFHDCLFTAFLEHASNHVHVRLADATAIDRWLWFKDCLFNYESENYTAAGTGVMNIPALTQGRVIVQNCMAYSDAPATVVKWDVNDNNKVVLFNSPTPAADTAGVGRFV